MLTKEQAEQIKLWRISKGCTYRRVAELAADLWEDLGIDSGNQIDGRELCCEAEQVLNEDWVELYGL